MNDAVDLVADRRDDVAQHALGRRPRRDAPWALAAALAACVLFIGLQVSTYPLMDGWGYYPLGDLSLVPYRDYFFPVTPLTYWQAAATSALGLPLIASRLIFLLVPIALSLSLYSLARIYAPPRFSFTVSVAATASLAMMRLETLQGWNLQPLTYVTVGVAFLARAWTQPRTARSPGARQPLGLSLREWGLCLGAGTAFSAAALAKQIAIVPVLAVAVVAVAASLYLRLHEQPRQIGRLLFATLLAPTVLGILTVAYLVANGAWGDFVTSMLSGGGKQPSATGLIGVLVRVGPVYLLVACIGIAAVVACIALLRRAYEGSTDLRLFLAPAVLLLVLPGPLLVTATRPELTVAALAYWVCVTTLIVLVVARHRSEWRHLGWLIAFFGLLIPATAAAGAASGAAMWLALFGRILMMTISMQLVGAGLLVLLGATSTRLRSALWLLLPIPASDRPSIAGPRQRFALLLGVATLLGSFVNTLSSGGLPTMDWFLAGAVVFIAFGWAALSLLPATRPLCVIASSWLWMLVATTAVTVTIQPYSWFGWTEPSLLSGARRPADLGYVQGVLLAPTVASFYERLAAAENAAALASGSPDPTVFNFPNTPAADTITDLRPYPTLHCPTIWLDLCPAEIITESLDEFRARPADVIVWMEPDEKVLTSQGTLFSAGEAALRGWMAYRDEMVSSDRWGLVDVLPATSASPNRWPVYVYARTGT